MKYEFASRPWFAALHAIVCEKARAAAAADPDFSYTICEVFRDVPPQLATAPGGKAAWHARISGSNVEFGLSEIDGADMKAVAEYTSVLPLAQYDTRGDPRRAAELQAMSQALVAAGRLTVSGTTPSASGGALSTLHDSIARLTK